MLTSMALFSSSKSDLPMPLTQAELAELRKCEELVTAGIRAFATTGKALARIRDKQLYRESHNTFEEYVAERWKLSRSYASRLITAAAVVQELSPDGNTPLPASESQVRPLTTLPPEQRAEVWSEVVAAAPRDDAGQPVVSTEAVKAAVAKRRPKKSKKSKAPKPVRILVPGATVIVAGNAKFSGSVVEALQAAIEKLVSTERRATAA